MLSMHRSMHRFVGRILSIMGLGDHPVKKLRPYFPRQLIAGSKTRKNLGSRTSRSGYRRCFYIRAFTVGSQHASATAIAISVASLVACMAARLVVIADTPI